MYKVRTVAGMALPNGMCWTCFGQTHCSGILQLGFTYPRSLPGLFAESNASSVYCGTVWWIEGASNRPCRSHLPLHVSG